MPRTVLVPVDGSPLSSRALRHALREFPEAEIAAYHVIDLFEPDYADEAVASIYEPMLGSDEWYRFVGERRDRLFAEVDEIDADYDRSVATDSDIGDPTRLVLEYAADEDVDHVVLGAHGRTAAERAVYGSVTETVVRRAPVPVTVVR